MPIRLRIPPEKEKMIKDIAKNNQTTKTAVILEAVDEKLGIKKVVNRQSENRQVG